ncbi:type II toxin-antitoxin system HipA family toxin [Desulfonatronum thioautotrophicum]|uniref:type II toxin-antitoxin system HipA family toxin n=1 Tax=Desulfonatronum thioautotrophicum TaxID=617001 RepID=UPI000699D90B|nr:type II toxin-antitoxin system HipA family toxin [Desulfonatronum thioautotrophicum]
MIHVLADGLQAGALEKAPGKPHHVFTYFPGARQAQSVSLTMPVRLQSYLSAPGRLQPIFDMNLPEGFLRRYLEKAVPDCDDLRLLEVTGPSQVGRLEYRGASRTQDRPIPDFSVQEILAHHGAEDLFQELLRIYAASSGVSGVQPKVLVRDAWHTKLSPDHKLAIRGTTHMVKAWDAEYPHLAYNEFFCLLAAQYAGLRTPHREVSENGKFLVIERFDLTEQERYLGLEDFCVLAGLPSAKKYHGSYEQLTKVLQNYCLQEYLGECLAELFKMIAASVVLRNGDAHRKNFCLLSDSPELRRGRLAPAFDIVTTTAYLPHDALALTLDGSKIWPDRKRLLRFAEYHCALQRKQADMILEEVKQGVRQAQKELGHGVSHLEGFAAVGRAMMKEWEKGLGDV